MKIVLSLHDPAELEAFGEFATKMAAARRTAIAESKAHKFGLASLIDRAEQSLWRVGVPTEGDTAAEAVDDGTATVAGETVSTAPVPTRERGQPSPGKKRRTAAEIAEDDAAAAADAARGTVDDTFRSADQPNISTTPEDRQDPANPEPTDSPEDAAQDAADEAAETAATKTALTLDDVRNTLSIYVKAYGIAATQADGPKIIATVLGKDHDATAPCKVSDIPDDKIEAVIAEIKLAGKQNRFDRVLQEGVAA